MSISNTFDRFCNGVDSELNAAHKELVDFHNAVFANKRPMNWPDLCELEQKTIKAALNAGYRMACRDIEASFTNLLEGCHGQVR